MGVTQGPVRDPFDPHAQQPGAAHRHEQHQADDQAGRYGGDLVVDEQGGHPGRQERADHVHVAVSEVQQLENP